MRLTLREAWARIVQAEDYEGHMADVGQAQANALLVRDLIERLDLPEDSRIEFAGCGPGQMFEFASWDLLRHFDLTFTDINREFLICARNRATSAGLESLALVDDIEEPTVAGPFDLIVLVLVLEHVDWRKSIKALSALDVERFLIVIQKNPVEMTTNVSPHRPLRGSLAEASKGEEPHLIDEQELTQQMCEVEYVLEISDDRPVPDDKFMCGRVYRRSQR